MDGERLLELLDVSAALSTMDGGRIELSAPALALRVVNSREWQELVESPIVAQRVMEVEAARYQRLMGDAAREHDWVKVENLLGDAEVSAGENPWVREVLTTLRGMARRRDDVALRKESRYSAACMNSRLADKYEDEYDVKSMNVEMTKAAYLRRKREQGRREFEQDE